MDEETKCQSIFRNLVQASLVAKNQSPTVFIRELEATAQCDRFYDLSTIRAAYRTKVGEDSMQRIATYDETEKDARRAEQAAVHHHDWTQSTLIKALSWQNWIWYQTVYKLEHTVSVLTGRGGVVGGWKFVPPIWH